MTRDGEAGQNLHVVDDPPAYALTYGRNRIHTVWWLCYQNDRRLTPCFVTVSGIVWEMQALARTGPESQSATGSRMYDDASTTSEQSSLIAVADTGATRVIPGVLSEWVTPGVCYRVYRRRLRN